MNVEMGVAMGRARLAVGGLGTVMNGVVSHKNQVSS